MNGKFFAFGAIGTVILLALGGDDEEAEQLPSVGFKPDDAAEAEARVGAAVPVDLSEWIGKDGPECGCFHAWRRGETLMGKGRKSVTWRALYREAMLAAMEAGLTEPEGTARKIADNVDTRRALADLILAGLWNDLIYSTWGYDSRALPGPHGRSFPFRAVHADVRKAIERGDAPRRSVELGDPKQRGDGSARETATGDTREFTWLPFLDREALLRGEVTSETADCGGGSVWPDGVPLLEPPPEVRALGIYIPRTGITYPWRIPA